MKLVKEREAVVCYLKKMASANLTTGTGGNISVCNRDSRLVAVSPSSVDYSGLETGDIVVLNFKGEVVEGDLKPSSETQFHLALYRRREEINCVVHTHSVFATTFACLRREIPAVHYLIGFAGGKIPLADYATFGTDRLAKNIVSAIGDANAVLLANHGVVAVGNHPEGAYRVALQVEYVARLCYQAECIGSPVSLSEKEMNSVMKAFEHYGQGAKDDQ